MEATICVNGTTGTIGAFSQFPLQFDPLILDPAA
jgi:hypothetical protein